MSDNLESVALDRVRKARVELIQARRFYGVLVSNVEPVISRKVDTAATDTRRHYFNPEFVATLSQEELLGTQVHESEHDARHHGTRRMGRDLDKWNAACDLAIDQDIIAEGFKLPAIHLDWLKSNWLPKYRGLSAEDIYRIRELDEQQEQPQEGNDQSEGESQSDGDESEGGGESEPGDDQGDGEQAGDKGGDEEGEDTGEGQGNGEGGEEAGDDQGQGGDGEGDGKEGGEGKAQPSHDVGRCGEVLDAADDAGELAESDSKWERVVRQAASMAKAAGQLPGHITREIERANNPTQDWREVLRAWIDGGSRRIETWNRPNRRFIGRGLYLPGTQRDGINKVVFVIDTSGSMDGVALQCVRTEAQAALDDGAIDEVVVVYGDVAVTRVDTYHDTDEIEFDPRGGGGTDLKPLFKYVADNHDDASLIVVFTDGYIGDPGPQPDAPVLFAFTGYPQVVRQMIANAPWSAAGIDVGTH